MDYHDIDYRDFINYCQYIFFNKIILKFILTLNSINDKFPYQLLERLDNDF